MKYQVIPEGGSIPIIRAIHAALDHPFNAAAAESRHRDADRRSTDVGWATMPALLRYAGGTVMHRSSTHT